MERHIRRYFSQKYAYIIYLEGFQDKEVFACIHYKNNFFSGYASFIRFEFCISAPLRNILMQVV